jgi:hypothetical protein
MTSIHGYIQANDYSFKDPQRVSGINNELSWQPESGTIADLLSSHPFMEVILKSGYANMFGSNDNLYTVFVPLMVPPIEDIDYLTARNIVRFSTLPTTATINVVKKYSFISPILNGSRLYVTLKNGEVYLDGSNPVIKSDFYATNGIIHFVERPLVPSNL